MIRYIALLDVLYPRNSEFKVLCLLNSSSCKKNVVISGYYNVIQRAMTAVLYTPLGCCNNIIVAISPHYIV